MNFNDAGEACSSFDVVLQSFVTSWMSLSLCFWRNFGRSATSGKVHYCFFPFGDNGSYCVFFKSKSL